MTTLFNQIAIKRIRQQRKERMQEVVHGIWPGSIEAALDEKLLARHGITRIVTVFQRLTEIRKTFQGYFFRFAITQLRIYCNISPIRQSLFSQH